MHIPTLIQEQNVMPGITNRVLSRFVSVVALGSMAAVPYFPKGAHFVETGNPIRAEVMTVSRGQGLLRAGLKNGLTTILVSGGSRGAHSINRAMVAVYRRFAGRDGIQILHVTGKNEYNNQVRDTKDAGMDLANIGNIIVKPYLYNMPDALAAADLAIFRAGAIGLAELTAKGIPAILVPYPYAAENHQEFNARNLEKKGAAIVIRDAELTGESLADTIEKLLGSRDGSNAWPRQVVR